MNPDELHTGHTATENGWRYQMIYIDSAMLENITGLREVWFKHVLRHEPTSARRLSLLLHQIWQTSDPLTTACLLQTLGSLVQQYLSAGQPSHSEPKHRLEIAREYLRENLNQRITLAELASLVHLSPYHFLRQFRAQYHVTPQQMLMAFRLFKAKQLLALGMASATVAAETGLTDQSHLIRAFTARYGTTPARYQKLICR